MIEASCAKEHNEDINELLIAAGSVPGKTRGKYALTHHKYAIGLLFYILAISKAISEWVSTCDNAHSWGLNSAAPLGN